MKTSRDFTVRYYSVGYIGSSSIKDLISFIGSIKLFKQISIDGDVYYIKIYKLIDGTISGYIVKDKGNSHDAANNKSKEELILQLGDDYLIEKNHFIIYPEINNNTLIAYQNINGGTSIGVFIKYINRLHDDFSIYLKDIIASRSLEDILEKKVITSFEIDVNVPNKLISKDPHDFSDNAMTLAKLKSESNAAKLSFKVSNAKLSGEEINKSFIQDLFKFASSIVDYYPKRKSKRIVLGVADEAEPIDLFLSRVFSKITVQKNSYNLIDSKAVLEEMRSAKSDQQEEFDYFFSWTKGGVSHEI